MPYEWLGFLCNFQWGSLSVDGYFPSVAQGVCRWSKNITDWGFRSWGIPYVEVDGGSKAAPSLQFRTGEGLDFCRGPACLRSWSKVRIQYIHIQQCPGKKKFLLWYFGLPIWRQERNQVLYFFKRQYYVDLGDVPWFRLSSAGFSDVGWSLNWVTVI